MNAGQRYGDEYSRSEGSLDRGVLAFVGLSLVLHLGALGFGSLWGMQWGKKETMDFSEMVFDVSLQWEASPVSAIAGAKRAAEKITVPRQTLPQLTGREKVAPDHHSSLSPSNEKVVPDPRSAALISSPLHSVSARKKTALQALKKQEALRRLLTEKARREQRFSEELRSPSSDKTQLKQQRQTGTTSSVPTELSGRSQSGDELAEELAEFSQKIQRSIAKFYTLPEVYQYAHTQLKSSIAVRLDARGELLAVSLERSSGDQQFDALSLNIVRRADPLPAPPQSLASRVIVLHFKPRP